MIEDEGDPSPAGAMAAGVDPIDESFLNHFRAMGTSSRDDLIRQFKSLTSPDISDEHCEFFLDSSSWNLQVALCLYFDTNVSQQQFMGAAMQQQPLNLVPPAPPHSPKSHVPTPILTPELEWETTNILDEHRPSPLICLNKHQLVEACPGQIVATTWMIQNCSDEPFACGLQLMPMAAADGLPRVPIPEPIGPNQTVAVFTEVLVHQLPGVSYSVYWHIADSQNRLIYNEPLTLRIKVLPGGTGGGSVVSGAEDSSMMDS